MANDEVGQVPGRVSKGRRPQLSGFSRRPGTQPGARHARGAQRQQQWGTKNDVEKNQIVAGAYDVVTLARAWSAARPPCRHIFTPSTITPRCHLSANATRNNQPKRERRKKGSPEGRTHCTCHLPVNAREGRHSQSGWGVRGGRSPWGGKPGGTTVAAAVAGRVAAAGTMTAVAATTTHRASTDATPPATPAATPAGDGNTRHQHVAPTAATTQACQGPPIAHRARVNARHTDTGGSCLGCSLNGAH